MATKLSNIDVDEISLVDSPAVKSATIAIAKRDELAAPVDGRSVEEMGMDVLRQIGKILFPDDTPKVQFAKACETPEGAKTYAIMRGYAVPDIPDSPGQRAHEKLMALARNAVVGVPTKEKVAQSYTRMCQAHPDLFNAMRGR